MKYWRDTSEEKMPTNKLVLVKQALTGICLREMCDRGTHIELYDENNILDDSELEIISWCEIPDE